MDKRTLMILFWVKVIILLGTAETAPSNTISRLDQKALDAMSVNLAIRYSVNYNGPPAGCHMKLELKNTGLQTIPTGNWAGYFCIMRPISSDSTELRLSHVNGCLNRFQITKPSGGLVPGETLTVYFNAPSGSVAKTDVMPNWYVAVEGLQARTLLSTAGESLSFVGKFDEPKKWKLSPSDEHNPFTPAQRFGRNRTPDLDQLDSEEVSSHIIVPKPLEVKDLNKIMHVNLRDGNWAIHSDVGLEEEAQFLADHIKMKLKRGTNLKQTIHLKIGDVIINDKESSNSEAYTLNIDASNTNISIVGRSSAAVFWGIQSLLNLEQDGQVSHVTISDEPRFKFRELGIDVARNFQPKKEIIKIIDVMATYKLNVLHLHLTDDEGWRLEIPGLPELTEIGSRRCDDLNEDSCILSQLGSGPYSNNSGSGYYTCKDYREILEHARRNHVQVIPEIGMPGHSHASIMAMQYRFKKYQQENKIIEGKKYLLQDPNDNSHIQSVQFFENNTINPCLESTYTFVNHVVSAVKRLHLKIQPLRVIHIGGDEVGNAWTTSPACAQLASGYLKGVSPTHAFWMQHFLNRVSAITARHGLDMAVWEDAIKNGRVASFQNQNVYSYAWLNKPVKEAYKMASTGLKVIMSQATHLYLDQPYEPDPEERGLYWATRFTDTRKLFEFTPSPRTPLPSSKNIEGMAAFLWSETVRTPEQLEYMIFPRLLAFAERAWHRAGWEGENDMGRIEIMRRADWWSFGRALGLRELTRLGKMNIAYRVPLPGARLENSELQTNVAFPGLLVQYSEDGGATWKSIKKGLKLSHDVLLRTRSANGKRASRVIEFGVA